MNNSEQPRENKMGTMSVNRLLITMSVPIMISMFVQALYNIVDSIFVAQINENALTAVSLVFPVQNLMIAVASGTGVGVNALLSKSLGEKRFKTADRAANNALFLAFLSFLIFALIGIFFSRRFFLLQTDIEEIVNFGTSYMSIICMFSFGVYGQVCGERLLQSTGKTIFTMITQSTGAIVNIILDPIFIFGMFGLPKMGIAGAAIATVTGQTIAFLMAMFFNLKFNTELHFSIKGFRPDFKIISGIYAVGIPSILMIAISSVMTFGINKILLAFTTTATAVFGVYYKLQSFVFMPVFGINNGMVPVVAYNFGAKKPDRIKTSIVLSIAYAMLIMLIGFAIFMIFPKELLGFFNASDTMMEIGVPALRIISFSFLLASFSVVSCSVLQALRHGLLSLFISFMRQLVVLLPCAFILAKVSTLTSVWLAFPISEAAACICSIAFLKYVHLKEIVPMLNEKKMSKAVN